MKRKKTCYFCGRKFTKDELKFKNYIEIKHQFSYGSNYDGTKVKIKLCNNCFWVFVANLKYYQEKELYDTEYRFEKL